MVLRQDHLGFYLLEDWGRSPILVQSVRAEVEIRKAPSQGLQVLRLDAEGNPASTIPTEDGGDAIRFVIGGDPPALWYWISPSI